MKKKYVVELYLVLVCERIIINVPFIIICRWVAEKKVKEGKKGKTKKK